INISVKKAKNYSKLDPWLLLSGPRATEALTDKGGLLEFNETYCLSAGTRVADYPNCPPPGLVTEWLPLQILRLATRIFGIPYELSKRPTRIVVDVSRISWQTVIRFPNSHFENNSYYKGWCSDFIQQIVLLMKDRVITHTTEGTTVEKYSN